MLQYILTALAGAALAIVGMRVWQARESAGGDVAALPADDAAVQAAPAPGLNRKLLIGAGALVVLAVGVLALRQGDEAAAPVATAAPGAAGQQSLDDVNTMIARLAARLEKEPGDGEGFRMLGWSYVMTGQPDKAIEPYKRALKLLPGNALVQSGYGEALTGAAAGTVTPEAKTAFDKALALDPQEPRARHFTALWLAQHGQEREALDKWIALVNAGPADAPWQADVRSRITATATKLGVDVSARLKASAPASGGGAVLPPPDPAAVQAAGQLPPADRQAMIDGMVEGLAGKLKANPANPEGWARLLRSRMVLKQADKAEADLIAARQALAGDKAGLGMVNAAAREAGVPGA